MNNLNINNGGISNRTVTYYPNPRNRPQDDPSSYERFRRRSVSPVAPQTDRKVRSRKVVRCHGASRNIPLSERSCQKLTGVNPLVITNRKNRFMSPDELV
jgi:hypothetical protein